MSLLFSLDEGDHFEEPVPETLDFNGKSTSQEDSITEDDEDNDNTITNSDDNTISKKDDNNSIIKESESVKDVSSSSLDLKVLRGGKRERRKSMPPQNSRRITQEASEPIIDIEENKMENSESVKEEVKASSSPTLNIPKPSGNFNDHAKVTNPPIVDTVFKNITCIEFYEKLIANSEMWKDIFIQQENKDVVVPSFTPENNGTYYKRQVTFISPIKGAPMGPKETRVIQTHRVSMPNET